MTRLANSFGTWRPQERTRRRVGFVFLLLSTATLLTNAYYLQFAEPAVSRKSVAFGILALTALWFLVSYWERHDDRPRNPPIMAGILP